MSEPLGVVLAGGASRRMGATKALVGFAGAPLASYPLATLRAAGLTEVVLVARGDVAGLDALGAPVWIEPDGLPRHPGNGLVCALERADGRAIVALACDMPFVPAPLTAWLARQDGSVMPVLGGRRQPLLARWAPSSLPDLRRAARERTPLVQLPARLVDEAELARFGDTARMARNVNTPAELAQSD